MPVISKHLYIDPETSEVYVEPGDVLSAQVVEALDHIGAIRVRLDEEDGSSCSRSDESRQFDSCPKCGQWFSAHNGDGSCVED